MNSVQSRPRVLLVPVGAMTPIAPLFIPALRARATGGRLARSRTAPAQSASRPPARAIPLPGCTFWTDWRASPHRARPISSLRRSRSTGPWTRCGGTGAIPAFTSFRCPSAPPGSISWLNRIEGFWKILRQRALAGRVCSTTDDVDQALQTGVADWNRHPTPFLWNRHPTPFLWNRPPQPKRLLKRRYVYRI